MLTKVHAGSGVAIDLDAQPIWTATASGRFGSCRLRIPRDSAAWDEAIIYEGGRYLVEVMTRFGIWRGITSDRPTYTGSGVEVEAEHVAAWAGIRFMGQPRLFQAAPAGLVARYAVRQALVGLDGIPITLGQFTICPPLVNIELEGQPLSDVLGELTELTGQEWFIDDDLAFHWVMRQGRFHNLILTDDGRLFPSVTTEGDEPGEVIEIDSAGRRFVAVAGEAARLWPRQESEDV